MKRAAVIGASSMLGSEIIRQLSLAGISIIRIGRDLTNDVSVDLASLDFNQTCLNGQRADVLFHCASSFGGLNFSGLCENFSVNTSGAKIAVLIAKELGCEKLVFSGSAFSDPSVDPQSYPSYGLSKACCEEILKAGAVENEISFCSLRFSQLYDTHGHSRIHQPWFARIVAYISRGLDLGLPASTSPRNYLHVLDAARLMIASAGSDLEGIWNACHRENLNCTELAELARDVFASDSKIFIDKMKAPFRAIKYPRQFGIYEALGIQPLISMREGLSMIQKSETYANFGEPD
tara:strand:- start:3251 stop:4126 length:876 start_codon:yes stop_codon:yes gene_type:complete